MSANLPELGRDGRARAVSLAARQRPEAEPTSLVSYQSHGRLVVIGAEEAAASAAGRVGESLSCTLVVPGAGQPEPGSAGGHLVIRGGRPLVAGHLGRFTVNLEGPSATVSLAEAAGAATPHYDLVLDLSEPPVLDHDIPPVGYFAPAGKSGALERALAELVELKGEFEKPKYFAFDPELCAHGRSGLTGCTRCLDACPTRAITSAGDVVAVDPYLCQGAGSCVAACPSGAMSYAFPKASNLLTHLQGLLEDYRAAGGEGAVLLLHDGWSGVAIRERHAAAMPENVIPVEIEEIGSTGIDTWLAALAYGARGVRLAVTKGTPARVTGELGAQAGFATSLLAGMGYSGEAIAVVECDAEDLSGAWAGLPEAGIDRPARFAAPDDKRGLLRLAIEHLYRQAPEPKKSVELPRAIWRDPGGTRRLHALHGVRQRLPGGGPGRRRRPAAAQIHGVELRAMRAVRVGLPGGRHRAAPAIPLRCRGAAAATRAARGAAVLLHYLWQALCDPGDARHARPETRGPLDVPDRGGAAPAADVRSLPRAGHVSQRTQSAGTALRSAMLAQAGLFCRSPGALNPVSRGSALPGVRQGARRSGPFVAVVHRSFSTEVAWRKSR
jgi:ferredoxin